MVQKDLFLTRATNYIEKDGLFIVYCTIIPKFLCVSNSDLIRNHCTIFQKIIEQVKLSVKKNSFGGREISARR